ncbi:MAG: hypothetical protein FWE67_15350, partial [Planctomycetaceae bacterium]|nr:hypothetical protein [Planctomycetaceae bacterium]
MRAYIFIFVFIFITNFAGALFAQDKPLIFDQEILGLAELVANPPQFETSKSAAFMPSKQLKPAHEVWAQWEKLKAATEPSKKTVDADMSIAELKRLAENGNRDALEESKKRLLRLLVNESTSPTMLRPLAEIGHAEAKRILQKREEETRKRDEEKRRKEEAEAKQKEEDKIKEKKAEEQKQKEKEAEDKAAAAAKAIAEAIAKAEEAEAERKRKEAEPVDLEKALKESGFGNQYTPLNAFVRYGSATLKHKLDEAQINRQKVNQFDDAGRARADAEINRIQAEIRAAQDAIAKKTFFGEYTYSLHDERNLGGGSSSCRIGISTEMRHSDKIGKVTLPMQDIRWTSSDSYMWGSGIILSVSGSTASIGELVNNKGSYRARVLFKNLRDYDYVSAEVQSIEIITVVCKTPLCSLFYGACGELQAVKIGIASANNFTKSFRKLSS